MSYKTSRYESKEPTCAQEYYEVYQILTLLAVKPCGIVDKYYKSSIKMRDGHRWERSYDVIEY